MKKTLRMLILSLFLSLLFVGCEKDIIPIDPVVVVVNKPEINVTYNLLAVKDGQEVTLNWDTKYADSCFFDGKSVKLSDSTRVVVKYSSTNVFTFIAKGKGGTKEDAVSVVTDKQPVTTISLMAYPATILRGESSTISIYVENATSLTINGQAFDIKTKIFKLKATKDTTLVAIATGLNGVVTSTPLTLNVDLKTSYMVQNKWYVVLDETNDPSFSKNGEWVKLYNPCEYSDTIYFNNSFTYGEGTFEPREYLKYRVCDPSTPNKLIGSGYWELKVNQTELYYAEDNWDVIKLTNDTLRFVSIPDTTGKLGRLNHVRYTFASKKR